MNQVRTAVIGVGNMGSAHASCIASGKIEGLTLSALCDVSPERQAYCRTRYPDILCFSSVEELVHSGTADAVIVATPHPSHSDVAMQALAAGLDVLVEKPVDVSLSKAQALCDAADQSGKIFAVMLNQRTNPLFRKAREIVQSGQLGELKRTVWIITNWYRTQHYYDSGSWRATWAGEGGGVLLNQCPHQLDLWQWICGMPVKVQTHMKFGQWHDIEVEDDVTTYVEYENGATGVFVTTTGDAHGTNRFEIMMDKAKIVVTYGGIQLKEFEVSEPEWTATCKEGFACMPAADVTVETDGKNEQHNGVINAWGGAILRGEPLIADGREGINGLMLSNAMHLSAFLGKEVTLPIDEDLFYEELKKRIAVSRHKAAPATPAEVVDLSSTYGGGK